ncbi:cyclin-like protein [Neohortaea acidophila]|uniref:RNA polymerase II holoenzyme cyclin-like subunit n=1 Tax=Neohortaea acidophila TaxID=245834 RepID=A0A6A6PWF7_9PEZI|nr:cyclin-like protein [Neohortaea acidophila]KAF2484508.1 cyclin-like protein [Neohortaea acidophila]
MTQALSEDDIYRTSTQYRLWSFSPDALASLRTKTREIAVERLRRSSEQQAARNDEPEVVEYLTEDEELRLTQRYCDQIRSTSDHLKWPVHVKATAVQYLKRFYLSNSCMTYPPKEIYKTVLYLASKTEAIHITVSDYARRISTDPEQVLAPEYKVMQALRFTLDVKQPFRGLKGVLMELLNLAEGLVGAVDGADSMNGDEVKASMLQVRRPPEGNRTQWTPPSSGTLDGKHLNDRIQAAYSAARTLLDAPALLTDVYFLYTPSQILLAAMHVADEPLTSFYLSTKLPISLSTRPQILATIHACADMLAAFDQGAVLTKDERTALEAKLDKCRDPGTKDLIKAFAAMRQDGMEDGKVEEGVAQKRKAAREKNERDGDDLFGPSLPKTNEGSR